MTAPAGRTDERPNARFWTSWRSASLLALAMHWPLPLHLGRDIAQDLGDPLVQAWQVAWDGHALTTQPLSLFQANMFWPLRDSLAFSDALVGYAPAGLIGDGTHAAVVRYDLLFLFAYAMAFAGAYAARAGARCGPRRRDRRGHRVRLRAVAPRAGGPPAHHLQRRDPARARALDRRLPAPRAAQDPGRLARRDVAVLARLLARPAARVPAGGRAAPRSRSAGCAAGARGRRAASRSRRAPGCCASRSSRGCSRGPYMRVLDNHPEAQRTIEDVAAFSGPPVRVSRRVGGQPRLGRRDGAAARRAERRARADAVPRPGDPRARDHGAADRHRDATAGASRARSGRPGAARSCRSASSSTACRGCIRTAGCTSSCRAGRGSACPAGCTR